MTGTKNKVQISEKNGIVPPNCHLGKLAIDALDLLMKKMAADSKVIGKKPESTPACLVNSSQGKDTRVLFRLNYSIHTVTLDVIQILDCRYIPFSILLR